MENSGRFAEARKAFERALALADSEAIDRNDAWFSIYDEYRNDSDPRVRWMAGTANLNAAVPHNTALCKLVIQFFGDRDGGDPPDVVARAMLLQALMEHESPNAGKLLKKLRKVYKKHDDPETRRCVQAAELASKSIPVTTRSQFAAYTDLLEEFRTVRLPPLGPTIDFGHQHIDVIAEHHFGRDDQRLLQMGAAYIEWPDERPEHVHMAFAVTCHQCGTEINGGRDGYLGFTDGQTDPCPSCGNRIDIGTFRAWEKDIAPGLYVYAVPYTTSKGAELRPIEWRSLEMEPTVA